MSDGYAGMGPPADLPDDSAARPVTVPAQEPGIATQAELRQARDDGLQSVLDDLSAGSGLHDMELDLPLDLSRDGADL